MAISAISQYFSSYYVILKSSEYVDSKNKCHFLGQFCLIKVCAVDISEKKGWKFIFVATFEIVWITNYVVNNSVIFEIFFQLGENIISLECFHWDL